MENAENKLHLEEGTEKAVANQENPSTSIKVFKRRWAILLIYVLYSAANSFQWMEYSIIANIIMRFYKVTSAEVDWTSIIYMLIYPIIVLPVSYFIEKKVWRDLYNYSSFTYYILGSKICSSLWRHRHSSSRFD